MEEVIAFLSLIAKNIQQLNHHLDTTYHDASLPSQNAFYQQAISSLLQVIIYLAMLSIDNSVTNSSPEIAKVFEVLGQYAEGTKKELL